MFDLIQDEINRCSAPTDSPSDVDGVEHQYTSCCVFTSSVLISLWAFLSLYLHQQTPPHDLLAFLCTSATSSGSLSDLYKFSGSIILAQTEAFRN
ncbi:hypothetical protein HanIR_Chr17g0895061 [Helianthus annuus]|nr:hypothetical protein HanIR_Chr17g0895061 [Helianthus annuus]